MWEKCVLFVKTFHCHHDYKPCNLKKNDHSTRFQSDIIGKKKSGNGRTYRHNNGTHQSPLITFCHLHPACYRNYQHGRNDQGSHCTGRNGNGQRRENRKKKINIPHGNAGDPCRIFIKSDIKQLPVKKQHRCQNQHADHNYQRQLSFTDGHNTSK